MSEMETTDTRQDDAEQVEQHDVLTDKPAETDSQSESETADTGEAKKDIDYEKSFKELQAAFTRETQRRAEMEKEHKRLIETLSSLGGKKEAEQDDPVSRRNERIDELRASIESYRRQGLDTKFLDTILDHELRLREHELMQVRLKEATGDLENFLAEHGKEIDNGQYTIKDLANIQMEAEKKGQKIDLKTARAVYIERNLNKIISNEVQKKLKASLAKGHDYSEFEQFKEEDSASRDFFEKVWRTR